MKLLTDYMNLQRQIYDYFGYVEDWVVIPLVDHTEFPWALTGEGSGDVVRYAETVRQLEDKDGRGDYCECPIYTQRFLPKWVYKGADYTMVVMDTQVDGNKFLAVFDNAKKLTWGPE